MEVTTSFSYRVMNPQDVLSHVRAASIDLIQALKSFKTPPFKMFFSPLVTAVCFEKIKSLICETSMK